MADQDLLHSLFPSPNSLYAYSIGYTAETVPAIGETIIPLVGFTHGNSAFY